MIDNLTIHFGTSDDVMAIAQFQVDMAMESEGTVLDIDTVKRGVAHAMEDSNKGRYVIAYADGKAVGSLMLTREWSDWTDKWYLWIQSVYVAPEYRGRGVYKAMYNKVKETAEAEGISTIRLYVDKTNLRAQSVYQKLGMLESHYLLYEETLGNEKSKS